MGGGVNGSLYEDDEIEGDELDELDEGGYDNDYDDDDKAMKSRANAIARTLRTLANAPRALLSAVASAAGSGNRRPVRIGSRSKAKGKGDGNTFGGVEADGAALAKIAALAALMVFLAANMVSKHAKDMRRWEALEANAETERETTLRLQGAASEVERNAAAYVARADADDGAAAAAKPCPPQICPPQPDCSGGGRALLAAADTSEAYEAGGEDDSFGSGGVSSAGGGDGGGGEEPLSAQMPQSTSRLRWW